jgi:hypothetical protein
MLRQTLDLRLKMDACEAPTDLVFRYWPSSLIEKAFVREETLEGEEALWLMGLQFKSGRPPVVHFSLGMAVGNLTPRMKAQLQDIDPETGEFR